MGSGVCLRKPLEEGQELLMAAASSRCDRGDDRPVAISNATNSIVVPGGRSRGSGARPSRAASAGSA